MRVLNRCVIGCILGTAVGDSLGLPYEGLSPDRARRMLGASARHRLLPRNGMVSDDTEHACFTAQALLAAGSDPEAFERRLAWSLRWWLLGVPAGVGFATLRSILKLWLGFSPRRSGVFSAGNGPAMRSALLGVAHGNDLVLLASLVRRSTRLTHTDPKACYGAMAVAVAAHCAASPQAVTADGFLSLLGPALDDEPAEECMGLLRRAAESAEKREPLGDFAASIGSTRGIAGYTYHTVPCVIQVWLRHPEDFRRGVLEIIAAGGDADTMAAILGGIIGARVGTEGIPPAWLNGILDWPRSVRWMERLGERLAESLASGEPARPLPVFVPAIPLRNLLFLSVVLFHGFRRLAPPY